VSPAPRLFVTGGASGLGRAIAQRFAHAGWRVALGDIDDGQAEAVRRQLPASAAEALAFHCDVRQEADLAAVAAALVERWGGVDVVVNNAGVAQADAIEAASLEDWTWVLDINLLGVVRGCRVFTPLFKRQGSGHFVNVASMAGLVHPPFMAAYNASKAAVVAISETLSVELCDDGIGVTVACPAFFQTNLARSLRTTDPHFQRTTERLLSRSPVTAEAIADRIFRAVARRELYVLPHAEGRLAWRLKRLLPHRLYRRLMIASTRGLRPPAKS